MLVLPLKTRTMATPHPHDPTPHDAVPMRLFNAPAVWYALAAGCIVLALGSFFWGVSEATRSCVPCDCMYSVFARVPRCRWPAILGILYWFFPITLGPMRMLTERGLALKKKLSAMGYRAVECYPGAAQDVWGLPRQHRDREGLLAGLRKLGVRGLSKTATSDELDASTAALV